MAIDTYRKAEVSPSEQQPGYLQVDYNPDAFGAGIGRALQQLGATTNNLGEMIAQIDEKKKANDVVQKVQAAKDELRPLLFDSQFGVYAQQGANAMGGNETVNAALKNIQDKYLEQINDPKSKEVFTKLWASESEQTKDKTALHVMKELGTYAADTAKTSLAGAITDAYNYYNDPKAIAKAINTAETVIGMNAQGLPPEAISAAKAEAKSQITLAAISRWASEDPYKALDFYEAHKDALSGKDHIVASQFINTAKDARDAQDQASYIRAGGNTGATELWNRLVQTESSGNPNAVSPKNAIGLSQIRLGTARDMLVKLGQADKANLSDGELKSLLQTDTNLNQKLGKLYLSIQLNDFHGDVEAALVAYNAGPEAAKAFLAANVGKRPGDRTYDVKGWSGLKSETQDYVQKILGASGVPIGQTAKPGTRMTDSNWTLKNFAPDDLMAPTKGGRFVDAKAATALDNLATIMGQRYPGLKISVNAKDYKGGSTAGYRRGTADPNDNPHVAHSRHLTGDGFDVQWQGMSHDQRAAFITEARRLGFTGFGFYGENGHVHIDMGRERSWNSVPSYLQEAMKTPIGGGAAGNAAATASGPANLPNSSAGFFGLGANEAPGAFLSTKSPDLNAQLEEANLIPDPGLRSRTVALIRSQAAQEKADLDAANERLKQAAWDEVLKGSGVLDLPKEILSRLGPDFINKLNTFEENRSRGVFPQDDKVWSSVALMSPEDLAAIKDPYSEYRNSLDNAHFDKLISLIAEAKKQFAGQSYNKELMSNQRSSSQILTDIFAAQGWERRSVSGATNIANFSKTFDAQVLAAQQIKGESLTSTELQDIADKLLIKNKAYHWGNKIGFEETDPNNFQAADTWDQVQKDDQETLVNYYRSQFGAIPSQEEATDLYNRALRVWLGGTPTGPDEEKNQLRSALESALNYKLSDKQFETYYGKYLLKFLGR